MIAFLLRWLARLSPWMFIATLAYAAMFIQLKADESALEQPLLEKRDRFFGAAASDNRFWFVGGDGVVLETADAGLTWERQQLPGDVNLQATAVSPEGVRVVVGNQAKVFVGDLGSRNWKSYVLPLPEYANKLNQVQFFDAAFWVVGEVGSVYRLSADGMTWKDFSLGEDYTINDIARAEDGALWLAGEYGNLFRSEDNGNSWTRTSLSEETLRSIQFHSGEAVVVGNGGQLYVSADGGSSWARQPPFTTEHLFDVTRHAGHWVAVGDQGQIFRAETASGDWARIEPEGMSKSFFMGAVSIASGIALAGKRPGLVDNKNRWINWPEGE